MDPPDVVVDKNYIHEILPEGRCSKPFARPESPGISPFSRHGEGLS